MERSGHRSSAVQRYKRPMTAMKTAISLALQPPNPKSAKKEIAAQSASSTITKPPEPMISETVSKSVSTNTSTSTITEITKNELVDLKSRPSVAYEFAKESGWE